jgi:hypothetical protein
MLAFSVHGRKELIFLVIIAFNRYQLNIFIIYGLLMTNLTNLVPAGIVA